MTLIKLIIIAFTCVLFFYLFYTYLWFYFFIGKQALKSPFVDISIVLENPTGQGEAKYIALGDSLSAGVGNTNLNDTFVYQYALNLSKKYKNVNLLNLAQPGGTTKDVISSQLPQAIKADPDYVTLLIGTNDIHNKMNLANFTDNYQYILDELLTKTDVQIIVMNIPYIGSDSIVHPPFNFVLDFRIKQFNKAIEKLISNSKYEDRIKFVDLYKETYTTAKQNPDYYSSDLFHPSDAGYIFWSKIINAN